MPGAVLVVRHPEHQRDFYQVVLDWAAANAPEVLAHFDVRDLPLTTIPWSARVLVPWLQDPVPDWSVATYHHIEEVADACAARGIRVINRARNLGYAQKLEGAARIASAGLRTPRMRAIADLDAFRRDFLGFAFPFFVREARGHGYAMHRADTAEEARAIPLEKFGEPVVTELVDARGARDGLLRKFRYLACGDLGIPAHLQVSREWITRGDNRVMTEETRAEELAYIEAQDPHHERFQAARRALELDMVAFDYGYDASGEVVVWEANPFPHIHFSKAALRYRNRAVHRALAAMIAMYLRAAKLELPAAVEAAVGFDPSPSFAEPASAA